MRGKKPKRVASPGTVDDANLRKARFFLDRVRQTERAEPFDPTAVEAYLAAGIVFGKATQAWVAERHGGGDEAARRPCPGGVPRDWLKGTPLWKDPLCELFANTRNVVVHKDGSVDLDTSTSMTISPSSARGVGGGDPARDRRILDEHRTMVAARERAGAGVARSHRAYFLSPEPFVADRPAVDVVGDYLDQLERALIAEQGPGPTI